MLCLLKESPCIGEGSRYLVFTSKVDQYLSSNLIVNNNARFCYCLYWKCQFPDRQIEKQPALSKGNNRGDGNGVFPYSSSSLPERMGNSYSSLSLVSSSEATSAFSWRNLRAFSLP